MQQLLLKTNDSTAKMVWYWLSQSSVLARMLSYVLTYFPTCPARFTNDIEMHSFRRTFFWIPKGRNSDTLLPLLFQPNVMGNIKCSFSIFQFIHIARNRAEVDNIRRTLLSFFTGESFEWNFKFIILEICSKILFFVCLFCNITDFSYFLFSCVFW